MIEDGQKIGVLIVGISFLELLFIWVVLHFFVKQGDGSPWLAFFLQKLIFDPMCFCFQIKEYQSLFVLQCDLSIARLIHAANDDPQFHISSDASTLAPTSVLIFVDSENASFTFFANNFDIHKLDISFDDFEFVMVSEDDWVGEGSELFNFHLLVLFLQIKVALGEPSDPDQVVFPVVQFEDQLQVFVEVYFADPKHVDTAFLHMLDYLFLIDDIKSDVNSAQPHRHKLIWVCVLNYIQNYFFFLRVDWLFITVSVDLPELPHDGERDDVFVYFVFDFIDGESAASLEHAVGVDEVQIYFRVVVFEGSFEGVQNCFVELVLELDDVRVFSEGEVELFPFFEVDAEVGEDEVLFFLLFAQREYLVEGQHQGFYVVFLANYQCSFDGANRSPEVRVNLVGEQVSIDGGVHYWEHIVLMFLVSADFGDVADKGQARVVFFEVESLVLCYFFLEVVGEFEQREVVVVLFGHEFYDFLFGPALFLVICSPFCYH